MTATAPLVTGSATERRFLSSLFGMSVYAPFGSRRLSSTLGGPNDDSRRPSSGQLFLGGNERRPLPPERSLSSEERRLSSSSWSEDRRLSGCSTGEADRRLSTCSYGEADRRNSVCSTGETDRRLSGCSFGEADRRLSGSSLGETDHRWRRLSGHSLGNEDRRLSGFLLGTGEAMIERRHSAERSLSPEDRRILSGGGPAGGLGSRKRDLQRSSSGHSLHGKGGSDF